MHLFAPTEAPAAAAPRERADIPAVFKWNLTHIFADWQEWEAAYTALDAMIGSWPRLPVIMSGMIGSRQGWAEAPYANCPAATENIVMALATVEHAGRTIALVPGLACENGGMPDVMRGEETQILGALEMAKNDGGVFLLPGTHSKWAGVTQGWITSFRTFMTGEVFGALKGHTILGRLMRDGGHHPDGFARGVRASTMVG